MKQATERVAEHPSTQPDLVFGDVEDVRKSIEEKEKKGILLNEIETKQKETDAQTIKHGIEDHDELEKQYRH